MKGVVKLEKRANEIAATYDDTLFAVVITKVCNTGWLTMPCDHKECPIEVRVRFRNGIQTITEA